MQDAWRAYLELVFGLTEASKKRAQKIAKNLTTKGGATAAQLQALAEDMVSASVANREALTKLVRFEVDRALGVVGLATADEVADLTARVRDLERQLRDAEARASVAEPTGVAAFAATGTPAPPPPEPPVTPATGAPKRVVAKKTTAKKAVGKQAVAKKAVAKKAVATKGVTTQAVGKRAVKKAAPAKGRAAGEDRT